MANWRYEVKEESVLGKPLLVGVILSKNGCVCGKPIISATAVFSDRG